VKGGPVVLGRLHCCTGERGWKVVLFDLDDTLFDQRQWLSGAFLEAGKHLEDECGIPARETQEELLALSSRYGSASGSLFNHLLTSHGIMEDPVLIRCLIGRFYEHRPETLEPYHGVLETLSEINNAGLICGVITNGRQEIQCSKIDALGIGDFFSLVLVSGMFGDDWKKPASRMHRRALAGLGVEGSACVYVGDNPTIDFVPARETGCCTVRVLKGEYASVIADTGTDADCTIDEIPELTGLLGIAGRRNSGGANG
jgi:putative hydrolase of the HAD superfamily